MESGPPDRIDGVARPGGRNGRIHRDQRPSSQQAYRIDVPLYRSKEELVAGFEFVLELGDQTFTMD